MVTRLALLLLLLATPARADLIGFFGDERVGTSGGQFLRIPVGARAVAMGGGMSASVEGTVAVFWNPAALATLPHRSRAYVSHMEYAADIDIHHAAVATALGPWRLGLGVGVLRSGEIERTTEFHPNGSGQTFRADQFMTTLALGRRITDRFALAGAVKFLQENLDDYENRAWMLDLGALYHLGYKNARIGFSVRNVGPDLQLNGDPPDEAGTQQPWQSFPAPTVAVFGFAYDFDLPGDRLVTVSLDFDHPSDDIERLVLGGEVALGSGMYVRGGFRNNVETGSGLTAGFGLHVLRRTYPLRFGYAFDDRGSFGGLHILSLEVGR